MLALLAIAVAARLPGVASRSIWYDEAISLLMAAGQPSPEWPAEPTPVREVRALYGGAPSLPELTRAVARRDVHPPGYYWLLKLWRQLFGGSIEAARWLSLILSAGTVLALYLLLSTGGAERPFLLALVYALSTGAVHAGHEARAYALAGLLITAAALCATLAARLAAEHRRRAAAAALAMAVCCGLATHTNYLALFPAAAVLAWFSLRTWSTSRALALAAPLLALAIVGLGWPTLAAQLDNRPTQFRGRAGALAEVAQLVKMNAENVGIPVLRGGEGRALAGAGAFVLLLAAGLGRLVRRWPSLPRGLWTLLLALAAAPSAGVLLLDVAFDKRLHLTRYVNLAGPALAVLLTYGLVGLLASPGATKRRLGALLLAALLALQATSVNWGLEVCPNAEFSGSWRSLAHRIHHTSRPSHAVLIARGHGVGTPGSVIYELDAATHVAVFGWHTDLERLLEDIAPYDDLWLVFSIDGRTLTEENQLLRLLETSGRYRGVYRDELAMHLVRTGRS